MVHKIPLALIIEEEKRRNRIEEGRRAYLELPLPEERPRRREDPRKESTEVVISYGEPDEEDDTDRGVTIISIFGDED